MKAITGSQAAVDAFEAAMTDAGRQMYAAGGNPRIRIESNEVRDLRGRTLVKRYAEPAEKTDDPGVWYVPDPVSVFAARDQDKLPPGTLVALGNHRDNAMRQIGGLALEDYTPPVPDDERDRG